MIAPELTRGLVHRQARTDFEFFLRLGFASLNDNKQLQPAWYLSAMAHVLERAHQGECRRLIITVPPRHLKSTMVSVLYTAWLLGQAPGARIIVVSYGQELADVLARDFRKVIASAWYASVFPETAGSIVKDTTTETTTKAGGYRYAAALGGVLTGRGADYLICDDLMKAIDAASPQSRDRVKRFFDETLLSRLDDKATGRVIMVQQRLHEDDIVAHALEKEGYNHLCLPAVAMEDQVFQLTRGRIHHRRIGDALNEGRESLAVLESLAKEIGPGVYQAQYQQNPEAPGGGFVRYQDIQFYDEAPQRHLCSRVLQSWDTAISDTPTSAYTAGTTWGFYQGTWLLLDASRIREDYSGVLGCIRSWAHKWKAETILIENAAMGSSLCGDLRRLRMAGSLAAQTYAVRPRDSKEVRLMSAAERLYTGVAKLPRSAPFAADLRKELQSFPNGKYDDLCDSLSQAINYINLRGQGLTDPPGTRPAGRTRPPGADLGRSSSLRGRLS